VALDAALLGAAALVWAAATAVVIRIRRTVLARTLPELPVDSTVVDRGVLAWGGLFALFGALLTALDVARGVLFLYCAGFALLTMSWTVRDNRQWWNRRAPVRRAIGRRYRALRPMVWFLLSIALLAWFSGWMLIGRIAVEALQG
jgi:hypothetical protein